jgi:hypothetical protein
MTRATFGPTSRRPATNCAALPSQHTRSSGHTSGKLNLLPAASNAFMCRSLRASPVHRHPVGSGLGCGMCFGQSSHARHLTLVCTENSVRVDYVTESPNVRDDPGPVHLAVQVEEPTEAENAALLHQLIILRRNVRGRVRLTHGDAWSNGDAIASATKGRLTPCNNFYARSRH